MKEYLIDTHAHIDMLLQNVNKSEISQVLSDMESYGVKKAIIPAVDIQTIDTIVDIASKNENIYAMIGLFPSEVKDYNDKYETKIRNIAQSNHKIVAVGEIGLDYYWDKSYVDLQKEVFRKQINLGNQLKKPLVIHDREAHKDCFDILTEEKPEFGVLFHCFSGSKEFMQECIKQGWYIAIGGVVTFKNAVKIKEVAEEVPLDKLVLETDAPYLTPVPYRGKPNKPAYVRYVAEEIAKIRNISVEEIIDITTTNAERFFKI